MYADGTGASQKDTHPKTNLNFYLAFIYSLSFSTVNEEVAVDTDSFISLFYHNSTIKFNKLNTNTKTDMQ